ncbi:MAG: terminase [Myxococcales bacterium]|nr:MAG: terminase [Myxococcales bacterium]
MSLAPDLLRRLERDDAAGRLLAYAGLHHPGFLSPWHLELLAGRLEAVERGDLARLMVLMPPRHGKSLLASTMFPAWYLGRHPDRTVLFAAYASELARDFGRRVRNLVASDEHRATFPRCSISRDSSSTERFDLLAGGAYYAVGRGGSITGRGADVVLVDDPLKDRAEADSAAVRKSLHAWYSDVAYTRLQPGGAVIVINTRWHEDDLSGWLLEEHPEEGWEVISLPAIAEADEEHRLEGEPLWPGRFPAPVLERIRGVLGGASFASLYQQRPAAVEGAIFKRAWWRTYTDVPAGIGRVVHSWDTAFKAGATNDYSACTIWGETPTEFVLLHAWRGRLEFPELCATAERFAEQWQPSAVLVEDKASGQSLIQAMQRSTRLPVLAIKVTADKVSRANAITPLLEAGKVLLPASAGWLDDYLDELSTFPSSVHDDWTDATTMALEWLGGKPRTAAMVVIPRPERSLRGVF